MPDQEKIFSKDELLSLWKQDLISYLEKIVRLDWVNLRDYEKEITKILLVQQSFFLGWFFYSVFMDYRNSLPLKQRKIFDKDYYGNWLLKDYEYSYAVEEHRSELEKQWKKIEHFITKRMIINKEIWIEVIIDKKLFYRKIYQKRLRW